MKSIKIFAVAGAIGLLCTAGLSSCKQKNTPEESGNYNGETVKTEFVISLAESVVGADNVRRMPGATVQIDQNRASFRGMDSICLIPFDGDYTARLGKNIVLSPIPTTVPAAPPTAGQLTDKKAVYYNDVAIPIGTQRFLFYGKAIDEADHDLETIEKKFQYGIVSPYGLYNANNNPSAIKFDLVPICSASDLTALADSASALATYVTTIANTSITTPSSKAWSSYTDNASIKELYDKFITTKAGSSNAILAMIEDLYNTLARFQETQVDADPLVAEIMKNIKAQVVVNPVAPAPFDSTLTWKAAFVPKNYPTFFGMPEGVAYMAWNGSSAFVANGVSTIGTNDVTPTDAYNFGGLGKIVYPASLQYFARSLIKTSANSQKEHYDNSTAWDGVGGILSYYENDNAQVKSNTKSVAIKDSINYGVGNLKIVLKRNASTKFTDNYGTEFGYSDSDPKLTWKGVLIGGQKQVNYDFTTNTSAEEVTIYDNYINGASPAREGVEVPNNNTAVTNYTLVFSTADNAGQTDKVYIVLEFTNTLGDFIGLDNKLIPEGGTFYLVGELDSSSATLGSTPPTAKNIFFKDFITTANINLGADCLKSAYYTIPDLRSSGLELGFAVSLTWQAGLEFTINL